MLPRAVTDRAPPNHLEMGGQSDETHNGTASRADARETWPSPELISSWLGDQEVDFEFRPGEEIPVHDDPVHVAAARRFRDVLGRFASGVTVVTDSTTYLPRQLLDRWAIREVSLYVGWEGDLRPESEYEDLAGPSIRHLMGGERRSSHRLGATRPSVLETTGALVRSVCPEIGWGTDTSLPVARSVLITQTPERIYSVPKLEHLKKRPPAQGTNDRIPGATPGIRA